MCGLCLPHCPTFGLFRHEAESPRGRISLMQAVARAQLQADAGLRMHLDHCLACRACEAMCPSQVRYGRLLRNMQEYLYQSGSSSILANTLATPARRRLLGRVLQLLRISGMQYLTQKLHLPSKGVMGRLLQGLPRGQTGQALPEYTPAQRELRGEVALFVGCTGDLLQRNVLHASRHLLSALGYAVYIPKTHGCCGALHVQQGDGTRVRELAQQNLAAFPDSVETIISVASGCGALLTEYGELLDDERADDFARRVIDINMFLSNVAWHDELSLQSLPATVAVHEPCSLRNVLHGQASVYELLRRIPQLKVIALPHNDRCCGAAGSYLSRYPAEADALRADKITAVENLSPDYLVSANIGCAMHLATGLRERGLAVEVLHPISLLARQLRNTS